ncbi:uncharacterized protein A4U43_C05F21420 [Asparagus officinalis]|uniref:Uncharacterized protein n=1 Tax=Asparagus officinalis TaxID=4686 RepID=A0A5P1EXR6_ASPOF|nr:transcription factor MYB80 [Asparagus officinalis]ONK69301.1 uncharacterized protein A4U43_C05F21420 [Asparagus officinalis]
MGRIPCCEKDNVKRGQWTPEEDNKLSSYIAQHGTRNWRLIPKNAGLQRCGKSCRLRWTNYLRPDLKHGVFSDSEEQTIVKLHSVVGNRWSLIAGQLPGRTDNDVKNHWNTKLKKKLLGKGIDPVTHKPFSHLMAEIATTVPPLQVAHLAEAALGCFKDEMLHLLTKKRADFPANGTDVGDGTGFPYAMSPVEDKEETVQKIKLGLSRAIMQEPGTDKSWGLMENGEPSDGLPVVSMCDDDLYRTIGDEFRYEGPSYANGEGSAWSQSMCTGSTCTGGGGTPDCHVLHEKHSDDEGVEAEGKRRKIDAGLFGSDGVLWDLSDDLMMNHIV